MRSRSRSKTTVGGAIGVAAVVLLVVALVRCRTDPARRTAATAASPVAPAADRAAIPSPVRDPRGGRSAALPVIDEITVEKTEVCEGEENLVTVKAHTPGGEDDAFLHGVIAGEPGLSVPVVSFRDRDGAIAPRNILVFGRGDVPVEVPLPEFEVKECLAERRLLVEYRLRPNSEAEFDLTARVQELAATTSFVPVRWRWDFGDGTREETTTAWTVHDFERRPQDALYASLLVRVEAIDAQGARVVGRQMIVLQNRAFANLAFAGTVTLSVSLTPRFPKRDPNGIVRTKVRIWHHRPDPVTIERVVVRRHYHDQRPVEDSPADVVAVLGTRTIPPDGIEVATRLDPDDEPGLFSIEYWLEGRSAEGLPVQGYFPVMTPATVPTRDANQPVRDPALVARIKRAREMLGQDYVTDEDLWALERQGAFADLPEVGTTPPTEPPRYGDLPPHAARPGEPGADTPLQPGEVMPVVPGAPPID